MKQRDQLPEDNIRDSIFILHYQMTYRPRCEALDSLLINVVRQRNERATSRCSDLLKACFLRLEFLDDIFNVFTTYYYCTISNSCL